MPNESRTAATPNSIIANETEVKVVSVLLPAHKITKKKERINLLSNTKPKCHDK